jgi:hypothetical protein
MNPDKLTLTLGALSPRQSRHFSRDRPEVSTAEPRTPHARRYFARFVRAGAPRQANGAPADFTITPEALYGALSLGHFNQKPVFLNHAGLWENPSLGNLVGRTGLEAVYNPADQSVEGEIDLLDTPAGQIAQTIIDDLLSAGEAHLPGPDIGLSIVFYPTWSPDRQQIIAITHIESVDLVFQPAADGRILAALSSQPSVAGGQLSAAAHLRSPALCAAVLTPKPQTPNPEQKEACMSTPNPTQEPQPVPVSHPTAPSEQWFSAIAASGVQLLLNASGLPEHSRQRLAAQHYATPQELTTAIEAERAYLATLQENQVVQIGGQPPRSPQITGVRTSLDRITLALEALMGGLQPPSGVAPLTGIRELYHVLSGDYEMTGRFQGDRITFANVNSGTMASLVANVMNKRVAAEFQNYNMWWRPVVVEEDFQSMQAIKWTILGGVGELPTVAEGAAYNELTWDDSAESGTFVKKGGYLGLTLEAIDKDETGRIRGAPRALAQAAWLTLSKSIAGIFTQSSGVGPTLSDTKALFHTDHANLGTTALSISSWNAARLAMRKQTELNSGERLGALTTPKFLLVPPDLEMTGLQVLATESDYSYTLSNGQAAPVNPNAQGNSFDERLNVARQRVIVVDLWTDSNDWAALADPRLYPTIGVGYRYGRVPEVFSVASPTAGLMFSNDTLPVKVRFIFAVAPIDYRGMYKANV